MDGVYMTDVRVLLPVLASSLALLATIITVCVCVRKSESCGEKVMEDIWMLIMICTTINLTSIPIKITMKEDPAAAKGFCNQMSWCRSDNIIYC